MNRHTLLGLISLLSFLLVSFTNYMMRDKEQVINVLNPKPITPTIVELGIKIEPIKINQTELFLNAIGHRESSNRYDVVNRWGYMGKYQFGKRTLKALGYDVSKKEFLNSPYLQEQAMLDLLLHNKKILNNYIEYWDGKKINGNVITESGILAAAHLAGPGNVKRFLKEGREFKDGNGTKLTSYLTEFSGYKLNLD